MDKRKMSKISAALAVLMMLAIFLLMRGSLRRTAHIILPSEDTAAADQSGETRDPAEGGIAVVEITPGTVQAAIATLARPSEYRRSVKVEQFWSGGSGAFDTAVSVRNGLTRTDRVLPGNRTRHAVTDGETTRIWYDSQTEVFTAPAGEISADDEQAIPTYETILELPAETLTKADYRDYQNVRCIFVETAPDGEGYFQRFWVSVDTGLLAAAERYQGETLIYRMTALAVELVQPDSALFALPDGTDLLA